MKLADSHGWDLPPGKARALQDQLAGRVITETTFDLAALQTVAGVDVSIRANQAYAAVVVLSFPDLEPLEQALATAEVTFPYVPGLLAFREGPGVLAALDRLSTWPDLFIFDAHGLAHPRRLGLASHMGLLLDRPSIGCAKSRLTGTHSEPGEHVGEWAPLLDGKETIGAVVRSRARVKPLFVSIGHRIDLSTAINLVLRCGRSYRLPETTRCAHKVAGGAAIAMGTAMAYLSGRS